MWKSAKIWLSQFFKQKIACFDIFWQNQFLKKHVTKMMPNLATKPILKINFVPSGWKLDDHIGDATCFALIFPAGIFLSVLDPAALHHQAKFGELLVYKHLPSSPI